MPFWEIEKLVDPHISATSVKRILAAAGYHQRKAHTVFFLSAIHRTAKLNLSGPGWFGWMRHILCWGIIVARFLRRKRWIKFIMMTVLYRNSSSLHSGWWYGAELWRERRVHLCVWNTREARAGGWLPKDTGSRCLSHTLNFYIEMLEERGLITFQQDGAGSHTAAMTRKWLNAHHIDILPHLVSSPDMNPIKPIWHILKVKICACPLTPTTQEGLK